MLMRTPLRPAFTPRMELVRRSQLSVLDRDQRGWKRASVWTADHNGDGIVTVSESRINTGDWRNEYENLMINFYRNNGPDNLRPLCVR